MKAARRSPNTGRQSPAPSAPSSSRNSSSSSKSVSSRTSPDRKHPMDAGDALKLRAETVIVPCLDLGDVSLRPLHGRVNSLVIAGNPAALLGLFREPRTIVDAVLESSRALGKEPRAWLDEQMPILDRFVHSRVLIPAGSDDDGAVRPRYDSGAAVAGWKGV